MALVMRRTCFFQIIALLALTLFAGCPFLSYEGEPPVDSEAEAWGADDGEHSVEGEYTDVTPLGVVGPAGGIVSIDDPNSPLFGTSVYFPSGALGSDQTVLVSQVANPPSIPSGLSYMGPMVSIETSAKSEPLLSYAEVSLPFNVLSKQDATAPVVATLDDETNEWEVVPALHYDLEAGIVTVRTSHFSWWAVLAVLAVLDENITTDFDFDADRFPTRNFVSCPVAGHSHGAHCNGIAVFEQWYRHAMGSGLATSSPLAQNEARAKNVACESHQFASHLPLALNLLTVLPNGLSELSEMLGSYHLMTFNSVITAMKLTGRPQRLLLTTALHFSPEIFREGGHTVLVYGYNDNRLQICDSNYDTPQSLYMNWYGFDDYDENYDHFMHDSMTWHMHWGLNDIYEEYSQASGGEPEPGESDDDHAGSASGATGLSTSGSAASGQIEVSGDEDFFYFDAQAGYDYVISTGGSIDTYLCLYAADGYNEIECNDDGGEGYLSRIAWPCTSSGAYYVSVREYGSGTGSYTVSVTASGGNPVEEGEHPPPDPGDDHADSASGATGLSTSGSAVSGQIEVSGDQDFFYFNAQSGYDYVIATGGGMDTYLCLYSTDGQSVIDCDDDGGEGYLSRIAWPCSSSGTYYVSVRDYGSSTGSYTVSVTASGGDPVDEGEYTPEPDDDHADSASGATGLSTSGSAVSGQIEVSGDADYFYFSAQSNHDYVIETTGSMDTYLRLYGTNGTSQLDSDDDNGEGNSAKIEWSCTSSGTHYAAVTGFGSGTGSYAVSVRDTGSSGGDIPSDASIDFYHIPTQPSEGQNVRVTVDISPQMEGQHIEWAWWGTDEASDAGSFYTNYAGMGTFDIPGAAAGVVDTITVSWPAANVSVTKTFTYGSKRGKTKAVAPKRRTPGKSPAKDSVKSR